MRTAMADALGEHIASDFRRLSGEPPKRRPNADGTPIETDAPSVSQTANTESQAIKQTGIPPVAW